MQFSSMQQIHIIDHGLQNLKMHWMEHPWCGGRALNYLGILEAKPLWWSRQSKHNRNMQRTVIYNPL